ncbi:MAG: DUF4386 domain-containing protein [Spirochaetae bacterium HGW-Spirochaetae-3]|jgi:hypothetical protein|nr:MAG: DUF4386 domain-containing protein [Spirochaetae bacterium HGW-Spirochaetae-3]
MDSEKKTARIAGLWYLAIAVFYSFSMIYVDGAFPPGGNAEATIGKIQASGMLFRLGFASCLAGHICFLFLVNALYRLFRSVNGDLARLMVILVISGVSVAFLNRLNQAAVIVLLSGEGYLSAFPSAQLHALAMFFLDMLKHGEKMATLFWGLWLLPLGLLIIKSGFIPKILAILLICTCLSYLAGVVAYFFFPDHYTALYSLISPIGMVSEVSFTLWLLIIGVKEQKTVRISLRRQ